MNRASKLGSSLSRKNLLKKNVDYQEECLLRTIHCSLKNGPLTKVQFIHMGKVFFI